MAYSLLRLRRSLRDVKDSGEFKRALEIWLPLVQGRRGTPRSIKRFGNLRYLAMLQQGEALDKSFFDQTSERLSEWFQRSRKKPVVSSSGERLSDHRLVALAAVHDVFGEQWRERLAPESVDWEEFMADEGVPTPHAQLKRLIAQYITSLKVTWPPSEAEMCAFERALAGIRLPGDGDMAEASAKAEARAPVDAKA